MKRIAILLTITFFIVSFTAFAEESVLINFSELEADYAAGDAEQPNENQRTLIDFSDKAGTGFTEEEKALMKTSLAVENWEVELASSSQTVFNMTHSMTKEVPVREDAQRFAGETVMGVRVHFPTQPYHSWAMVKPPFEIPAFMKRTEVTEDGEIVPVEEDTERSKFESFGVVKNVGVIKSVSMNVMGLNYPYGVELVLKDQENKEHTIFMGYLFFDGWRTLTWKNPNYITDVKNRELKRYPLYPRATPFFKLMGIRLLRDKSQEGGNFITYVHDISMTYDKAVLTRQMDINNEEVWGILEQREESRRSAEFGRLGEIQVLRTLEKKKMHAVESELEGAAEGGGEEAGGGEGGEE
jgi:hypothetical protein